MYGSLMLKLNESALPELEGGFQPKSSRESVITSTGHSPASSIWNSVVKIRIYSIKWPNV